MRQLPLLNVPSSTQKRVVNVAQVKQYSPFRYPGGKTWFIPRLKTWLASRPPPKVFLEPFAGGGIVSCTVAVEALAEQVVLVELDPRVVAVWQVIFGGDAERLAQRILDFELTPKSAAEILASEPEDVFERAWRTIVQNRVSHGGIIAPGGGLLKHGEAGKGILSRWYPETLATRIRTLASVRERVTVIAGDALSVLEEHQHNPDVAVFIDPPYTAGGKKAGKRLYTFNELDHNRLFALAAGMAGDVVMTYDLAPEVQALAEVHGLDAQPITMKNTHHTVMDELLIGTNLNWVR